MTLFKASTLVCITALLGACGGGGSSNSGGNTASNDTISSAATSSNSSTASSSSASSNASGNTSLRQGFFIDSAVANLHYQTPSHKGATNANGEFAYLAGEAVTFAIGELSFPPVPAQPTITPLTLASTTDINDPRVINMVRLLLSLDQDRHPDNGIFIDELAHGAATAVDFSLEPEAFAQSAAVTNLLSNSGASSMALVAVSEAQEHFNATLAQNVNHRTVASANGPGDTDQLFNTAFGGGETVVESPVCDADVGTDQYGPRITEVMDDTLNQYVFKFHLIRDLDGDRCIQSTTDRQRIEVKTFSKSPDDRIASKGEIHTYRWRFKLAEGFQASSSFTHVFQIKASGGNDDSLPIVTLTPRAGSPAKLQLLHAPNRPVGASEQASANLADFSGEWVEAFVRTRNDDNGSLEVRLVRLRDQKSLIDWSDNDIDMWRTDANINRPKWGLYRSLNDKAMLRDESVYFNDFCIAEGSNTCPLQR
jgi:hypothetical protein